MRKEKPKKKEEERKMATRSGVKEEKKTVPVSPPTTSPSDETKHYEDELRRAMALSEKEQRKGDGGFGFWEDVLDCKEGLHSYVSMDMHIYVGKWSTYRLSTKTPSSSDQDLVSNPCSCWCR